jgi:DNA topoisomerase VI subunit A
MAACCNLFLTLNLSFFIHAHHSRLVKKIHITKRDLFYTDVKLFVDQAESDGVLDDVATMIGCTRSNLHVVASDKGLVVGRVRFIEDGDPIDCTRMGVGGKAIPPYIDKIENIESDAEFILLVEKEAAYMRMAEDRFYHVCFVRLKTITTNSTPTTCISYSHPIPVFCFPNFTSTAVSLYCDYCQGTTRCRHAHVSFSTQGRTQNSRPRIGG